MVTARMIVDYSTSNSKANVAKVLMDFAASLGASDTAIRALGDDYRKLLNLYAKDRETLEEAMDAVI